MNRPIAESNARLTPQIKNPQTPRPQTKFTGCRFHSFSGKIFKIPWETVDFFKKV